MGGVGFQIIVGHTVLVNSTGDMTAVFFDSILKTSAELIYVLCVYEVAIFFWTRLFVDCFLRCNGILSLGCIRMVLRMLVPLKMTCNLVCQKSSELFTEARDI